MKMRFLKKKAQIIAVVAAFVACTVCSGMVPNVFMKNRIKEEPQKDISADISDDAVASGQAQTTTVGENEIEPTFTADAAKEEEPTFTAEAEDESEAAFTEEPGNEDAVEPADDAADEESEEPEEPAVTADFVIANVDTALNVRSGPSTDDDVVGKLYRGARAEILERGDEWTYIASGNVTGYASNDWLMFDEEAIEGLEIFGIKKATVTADALRVRREPSTSANILDLYEKGDELPLSDEVDAPDGWIAVDYSDKTIGYCSADYVKVSIEYDEALTLEEEAAIMEAKRLEEERIARDEAMAKALIDARRESVETANRDPIVLTEEEAYMMAACVHMEAGNQSYEGKLAVANVILNRLLDGYWGNTVKKVIYAKGQFTGVASGLLEKYMEIGPNEGCIKATADALAGINNIGKYMYFCTNRTAKYATYKSYVIIGDHTFYRR